MQYRITSKQRKRPTMRPITIAAAIIGGIIITTGQLAAIQYAAGPRTFAAKWNADQTELGKVQLPQATIEALHQRAVQLFNERTVLAKDDDSMRQTNEWRCTSFSAVPMEYVSCKQD